MTRITHLIGDLALGGSQTQLRHVLTGMPDVTHQVITWRDRGDRELIRLPDHVRHVHIAKTGPEPLWLALITEHLRLFAPDILHCWLNPASWWGAVLQRPARIPRLITSEQVLRLPGWRRQIHRLADMTLTDSQAVLDTLPGKRKTLVAPGIARATSGEVAEIDGYVVLCLASLQPDKDQEALFHVARAGHQVVLVGGDEDPVYARHLRATAPPGVLFVGEVVDPAPYLRRADVVVLPSRTESCPNAVLEAMSHGKPVAATAVGDVATLLNQAGMGRLVPPSDPAALLAAVGDPGSGARGPAYVQRHFSVEKLIEKLSGIYRTLTS